MLKDSHPHFVQDRHSGSRQDTAILLTGTAEEFGIDQHDIRATQGGFYITQRMHDLLASEGVEGFGDEPVLDLTDDTADLTPVAVVPVDDEVDDEPADYDPADYGIDEVKATVSEDPYTDTVEYVIEKEKAGKARKTLLTWLSEFEAAERPDED